MNSTNKKAPGARGVPQPFNRPSGHAPQHKPVVAQLKTGVSTQSVKRPAAPPPYRPQQAPKVLQTKSSSSQWPQAGQASRQPAAPLAYRPEPKNLIQPKAISQERMSPIAPPVYRSQPQQVNAQSSQPVQMKKVAEAGRNHPQKKIIAQSNNVKAILGSTVQRARPPRAASRAAYRRMGLDPRGRGRARQRQHVVRYVPPPGGQYGYFYKAVRANDQWVLWRVLEPGNRAIFNTGLMPYQGSRVLDYAFANARRGLPQPPNTVWHHVHDWRPGGGLHGRGSLALMQVNDHNRFHRGGVEQYNRHRNTVMVYV
jgi:hypothetical protein